MSSKTQIPAEGHGVGLTLYKKIIKVHKGEVWVKSDGNMELTFYLLYQ